MQLGHYYYRRVPKQEIYQTAILLYNKIAF